MNVDTLTFGIGNTTLNMGTLPCGPIPTDPPSPK